MEQRDPLKLLMAPTGVDKGSIEPDALIEVNEQGEVVAGEGGASAETRLHLEIIRHTKAGAVLHTHSANATYLSKFHASKKDLTIGGWEMLKGLSGINTHQTEIRLPIVDNQQNMEKLSKNIQPHLKTAPHGFLVAGHGLYSWGNDLDEAKRHVEILEFLLELYWRDQLLGALS